MLRIQSEMWELVAARRLFECKAMFLEQSDAYADRDYVKKPTASLLYFKQGYIKTERVAIWAPCRHRFNHIGDR